MKKWSFSKIDCWTSCQLRFKYIYLDKRGGEIKSDALAIGSGIHKFIEEYSLNPNLKQKELEKIFLDEARSQSSLVNYNAPMEYRHLVRSYMNSGKRVEPKIHLGKPQVERYFILDCGSGVVCSGLIDIISKNDFVVDYKTSARPYHKKDLTEPLSGKGLQLTIYGAAFEQLYGYVPKGVGFQVILKDGSGINNLATVRTKQHIDDVKDKIVRVDKQMKQTKTFLKARTKYPCKWCDFKHECGR